MKKLKELTLKEYTDLRRSGLMWIVFPDATGDFRDDCEEVKKVNDKCEWKDGTMRHEDILEMLKLIGDNPAFPTDIRYHAFEVFSFITKENPVPAEPLIVKSGETWVAYEKGIDYLCTYPEGMQTHIDNDGRDVYPDGGVLVHFFKAHPGSWKSFTGDNPDITELTDEIALLRPMVISLQDESNPEILIGVDPDEKSGWHFTTFEDRWDNCRLATAQELQE